MKTLPVLPILDIMPELRVSLGNSNSAVLSAPPGSGKTTIVPLTLMNEPWLRGRKIIMLEPRRLAARMAAGRMADILEEETGKSIGYQVRFDSCLSAETKIEVVTEGILIRRLQNDPELQDVGLVIFDEFHERNLNSDLALAFCCDIQQALRDDLRVLIMSATIDCAEMSIFLSNAPVVSAEGKSFPVTVEYLSSVRQELYKNPSLNDIVRDMVRVLQKAISEQQGDILAFLPGAGEIRQTAEELRTLLNNEDLEIHLLYGDLPKAAQNRAIIPSPAGRRKIVLATNIAETSLTIEGVTTVIDSGWRRLSRFDPNIGLSRFETVRISNAAATQRTHRAGRLAPGHCYRLWDKNIEQSMKPFALPEILDADLAPLALELAAWGTNNPQQLKWLTPPRASTYEQAKNLLRALEALDRKERITDLGRRMAAIPVHPRLSHMILKAGELGLTALACDLAALLSEREIMKKGSGPLQADISDRLDLLDQYRRRGGQAAEQIGGLSAACARVERTSQQLKKIFHPSPVKHSPENAGLLLAYAFPDRIGQCRPDSPGSYLLSSGRAARLPQHDNLRNQDYLVVPLLDAGRTDGRIFLAAPISRSIIRKHFAGQVEPVEYVAWDEKIEAVVAERREIFHALTLSSSSIKNLAPDKATAEMLAGIRQMGLACLPWDKKAISLRQRLQFLHHHQPESDWPDLSDEHLLATLNLWLAPFLTGITRRSQLKGIDLEKVLLSMLNWEATNALDKEAPTHIEVPSGSRIRLAYTSTEPPVLAVRIQEVFGMNETPKALHGTLPVVIHLLSPAHRPMQVTQDLANFWVNIYPSVKKELKGRYPKHHWPDDPTTAMPTAHAKKKKV